MSSIASLVRQFPARFYADDHWPPDGRLADLVTPLVVEADGNVVPLGYEFARRFGLGTITESRLTHLAPRWIQHRYSAFRQLCREVDDEACAPTELPFLNWHAMLGPVHPASPCGLYPVVRNQEPSVQTR